MEKSIEIGKKIVTVTDDGEVSVNGKKRKPLRYSTGYMYIQIGAKNYLVHRLVAHAFIQPLTRNDCSVQVHHINGNKEDNRLANLQVISQKEHAVLHKQIYPLTKRCVVCGKEFEPSPTKRKRAKTCSCECLQILNVIHAQEKKKPVAQYQLNGELVKQWDSASDIRNELGFFESNICKCCKGIIKTYKGFIWKYVEE